MFILIYKLYNSLVQFLAYWGLSRCYSSSYFFVSIQSTVNHKNLDHGIIKQLFSHDSAYCQFGRVLVMGNVFLGIKDKVDIIKYHTVYLINQKKNKSDDLLSIKDDDRTYQQGILNVFPFGLPQLGFNLVYFGAW